MMRQGIQGIRNVVAGLVLPVALASCLMESDVGFSGVSEVTPPTRTNNPPAIQGDAPPIAKVGVAYSFTPLATDPDADLLGFSINNKPIWLTFDSRSGDISGVPKPEHEGTYDDIEISVSDGLLSTTLPGFSISVEPNATANMPPQIDGTPAGSVTIGDTYTFTPTGWDPDGDPLIYSIQNGPGWASFSTDTGELSGTPQASDIGIHGGIAISVSDGTLSSSLPEFSIFISSVSSGLCWADQGTPAYSPYPENRNGTGGNCPESEGIGYGQIWGGYSQWPGTNPAIIHVTNRNDSGAGSLREALTTSGCRVVVFDVGGEIALSSNITVTNGCLTVNGHAAPGPVWLTLAESTSNQGLVVLNADQIILEGLVLNVTPPVTCANNVRAFRSGDTADNLLLLNMALLGGTDQNNSHGRGSNWQYIDTLFARPQGVTSCGHNYNFLSDPGADGLLLGMVFEGGKRRNPRIANTSTTWFNTYIYNAGTVAGNLYVDAGETTDQLYIANISDYYYDAGPDENGSPAAIILSSSSRTANVGFSTSSELHINNIRLDSGMCTDDWGTGCVDLDSTADVTEAQVRQDLTSNYPTGAVSTDISALSAADIRTLHLQNNGPHPNNRAADLQAIYTGMTNGTGAMADSYTYTPSADTSGVYSVPASPHVDGDSDGYPDLMDQFETDRMAMYAN